MKVSLQASNSRQPGVESIGGSQTTTIPLYDTTKAPSKPLWSQDEKDVPHADLNAINLRVPFWHDAIKIEIPEEIQVSNIQVIDEAPVFTGIPFPGDKVAIVGFPYGYSVLGEEQPTPVVLTRHVAATRIDGRHTEVLLDGAGAAGMSGGPVFIESEGKLLPMGLRSSYLILRSWLL